jgi:hypothetical protein
MEWVFLKISTSTYPRISKKHGKGQTDGSGQPFQGRSLTETVWDRKWVEFEATPFVFLPDALTRKGLGISYSRHENPS